MNKLDQDYLALCQDILDNGTKKQTRNGDTLSVFGRQIRHSMKDGFPLLTTKKMYWKGVVTELLWFLRGDTNIKFLVDNDCHIWDGDVYKRYIMLPKKLSEVVSNGEKFNGRNLTKEEFINKIKTDDEFAKKFGELGPIYGKQWRRVMVPYNMMVIDQIANLIHDLKTNPDSRRLIVNSWNVGELDQMVLPPCHYGFQVYTRELSLDEKIDLLPEKKGWDDLDTLTFKEKLEKGPQRAISLMFNMRSNDVPLGLPFNIASYGLLLEIIAKMVNMVPDELIGNLGDCHIYTNQIEGIKEQLTREPYPLPKLNINTEWWPTESGECGEGPINAQAVLDGFSREDFCKCLMEEDIQLANYKSHPAIRMPLSN